MHFNLHSVLVSLAVLAPAALAAPASSNAIRSTGGFAVVINKCSFPSYLWSVSPSTVGPQVTVNPGGSYSEAYQSDGGISIKLSRTAGSASLYNASPLTQFQYTLSGATVWYDLADTHGDPYAPQQVNLAASTAGCAGQNWPQGSGASAINNCGSSTNLTLTLCG